ncbi:hypothetical protein DFH07DRAFT_753747, partial [Mycena maculata]
KRKTARRANMAERRATHNAVEGMRRKTLNGQFFSTFSLSRTRARPPLSSFLPSTLSQLSLRTLPPPHPCSASLVTRPLPPASCF